jgi:DNA-directed RNA polymerase specialized sigma24 family protein
VLGTDFARTLRAAQAGEEDAFVRLWRDANPAMVRYLKVVGHDDPYDEACEGWVTVVRGLPAFDGDETHWRAWVLACARKRAEESTLRRSWGASTGSLYVDGDGDIDLEEVLEPEDSVDPTHRGIADTLNALRLLPLGQGEVVVLRLGAELPPDVVADVVGLDEVSVQRAEVRALERLGTETELVSWSLTAPPSRAELADEKIAVGAFRKVLSRARAERVKVIAVGAGSVRAAARQVRGGTAPRSRQSQRATAPGRSRTAAPAGRSRTATAGRSRPAPAAGRSRTATATATAAGRSRTAKATGRSRTAVLAITALSVSVVSLGGFGAAAYVGVLPTPVQQAMHDAVGAPAPTARDAGSPSSRTKPVVPTAKAGHPTASSAAAAGLCRAWSTDQAKGTARERSVAFQKLSTAAGGPTKVQANCSTALAPKPSRGAPTASVGGASPTGSPTAPGNGKGKGNGNGNGQGVQPGPVTTPGTAHTPQGNGATKATTPTKGKPTASRSAPPGKGQPTASKSATPAKGQPTASASPTPGPRSPSPKSTK